jgi:DNA-binding response OmpR family regulator
MGLNLGSDDYLPKPFDRNVLVSRIRAVFRRTRGTAPAAVAPVPPPVPDRALAATGDFKIGPYRVDVKRFALVDAKGREEALSFREIQVLRRLAEHPGEVISRDSLLNEFWGGGVGGNTRTVDQYVMKVRRKLGRAADCIETIHGVGYRYIAPSTP